MPPAVGTGLGTLRSHLGHLRGESLSKNIHVHDNTITIGGGVTGPTRAQGNAKVFT
jgi:hypothetical protein